jgi:hypothetical protein
MDDIIGHVGYDKEDLVKSAERIIARAIIEYFPGITLLMVVEPLQCPVVMMQKT